MPAPLTATIDGMTFTCSEMMELVGVTRGSMAPRIKDFNASKKTPKDIKHMMRPPRKLDTGKRSKPITCERKRVKLYQIPSGGTWEKDNVPEQASFSKGTSENRRLGVPTIQV